MKRLLFSILLVFSFLSFPSASFAKTSDEYLDEIYKLIEQGQFDDALNVVHKGIEEYPGDIGLVFAGAEVYHNKKDYETAIANYLNLLKAIAPTGKEAPSELHWGLLDSYNELGQKHYFPKELCLRIIYHTEKCFELEPKLSQDTSFIEFLRKTLGHYDVASMGTGNVHMMETGGDGAEFNLPEDNISTEEKMSFKDKAVQRINEYDEKQKETAFLTVKSDKTVEDIIQLINQRASGIKTIHFKRMNTANVENALLEEVVYKSPDKIKVVESSATSVIINNDYYIVDPQTKKVIQKDQIDSTKISLLKGIGFDNLQEVLGTYDLSVVKIEGCPDFLSEVCLDSSIDLYLITGKLIDKEKGPYPPTPKVEYFIDGQTGLCLAKRAYWIGILGSGKEEELAIENVVTKIEKRPDGIALLTQGRTKGYAEELANLNESWTINILSINQEIDNQEFSVSE